MGLLTSLLSDTAGGGGGTLANDRYGLWVMSGNYLVPPNVQVGITNQRFPFNTVKSGSFPDFNTTTNKLVVSQRGIYALGWDGALSVIDNKGGAHRSAIMRITTNSIPGVIDFIGSNYAISTIGNFPSVFGISGTTFLDVNDVVEFGFEYDGSTGLAFSSLTTLRIVLLHTL